MHARTKPAACLHESRVLLLVAPPTTMITSHCSREFHRGVLPLFVG